MVDNEEESLLRSPAGSSAGERKAREIMQSSISSATKIAQIAKIDSLLPAGQNSLRPQTAALFAAGEIRSAINGLLNEFNRRAGDVDRSLWYLLLDIYQIQNDRDSYEKLAEIFANHFRTSPPAWSPYPDQLNPRGVVNVLVVNGTLTVTPEKNRDFLRAARQAGTCRLDFSRMRLGLDYFLATAASISSPSSGSPPSMPPEPSLLPFLAELVKTMSKLRQYRVRVTLMGEEVLVQKIAQLILNNQFNEEIYIPYWLFLLECWQWRGNEADFEEVADKFMTIFELSPPGYESDGIIALSPSKLPANGEFIFPEIILPVSLEDIFQEINNQLGQAGKVNLDFAHVKRISFDAATEFAIFLKNLNIDSKLLTFKNLNEVLLAIFELTGITQLTFSTGKKH